MSSAMSSTDITGEETVAAEESQIFCFLCGLSISAVLKVISATHSFPLAFTVACI